MERLATSSKPLRRAKAPSSLETPECNLAKNHVGRSRSSYRRKKKGDIRVLPLDIQNFTLLHHGPSCSEDEKKKTERMRSASTTPRSVRGTHPDEYDRIVGVTSVGSHETVRFGEENVSGLESNQERVAQNSVDLDEAQEVENLS